MKTENVMRKSKISTSPSKELVKGFKDYSGEDAKKRAEIKKILIESFEKYGFEPSETPIVEYEEFVKGDNEKDEAVSDIFKLQDRGKRKLALRYEFTFQLKRLMQNRKLPFKRYQMGPVFRDEPVSANRFRQFVQCDADTIGSTLKDDAEILALTSEVMNKLGIKFTIYFNNRKLLNEVLEKEGVKEKEKVIKEIDKLDKLSEKEVKDNLKKYKAEKVLGIFKKDKKFFEKYETYSEVKELEKYLRMFGVKAEFNPSLARGLAYYNGTVFEVKTPKVKETITAGGAYEFNKTQCVGISFGLDRLYSLAKIDYEKENYLIVSLKQDKGQKSKISTSPVFSKSEEKTRTKAIKIAQELRKKGKNVSLFYGKPSKALDYANSYGISKVVFVGEKEVKSKKFKIKDMDSGKESLLKL